MTDKLLVPDIGDFENVEVIELLVKEGDQLNENDPVVTIESDKSSVEIPSTLKGKIEKINIKVGDKVSKGDVLLTVSSLGRNTKQENIPKNTENLILEAEKAISNEDDEIQKNRKEENNFESKKNKINQVVNDGDNDPLETRDWIDSLDAVIKKKG